MGLKVGTEWVNKGSTCTNAANSVAGIARAIYERTFRIVVEKCNETLIDPTMKKVQYIGVHTEVNIGPVKTLLHVLLLLEGEHVGVEELLELLVNVVDTDLLKAVVVEDLETSNIQDSDVLDLLHGGVDQGL